MCTAMPIRKKWVKSAIIAVVDGRRRAATQPPAGLFPKAPSLCYGRGNGRKGEESGVEP